MRYTFKEPTDRQIEKINTRLIPIEPPDYSFEDPTHAAPHDGDGSIETHYEQTLDNSKTHIIRLRNKIK